MPQTLQAVHAQVIHIHAQAPAKPAEGDACNGCGVCCSSAPCPMGALLSRRLSGVCVALRWHDDALRYRCAMVDEPASVLNALPAWLAPLAARLALRWIAAGVGCDCSLEAAP
jgi:hypothetical protein